MIWLGALYTAKLDGRRTEYEWIQMLLLSTAHVLLFFFLLSFPLSSLEKHSLNTNKPTFYKGSTFLERQATGRSKNAGSRHAWANRDVPTRYEQI
jgi:hypothetical protein